MVSEFEKLLEREREKAIFTPEGVLKKDFRKILEERGGGGGFISPSVIEEEAKLKREAAERARLQEEIRKRQLQAEIEKRQAEERTKEQRRVEQKVEQKKRVERSVSVRERTRDQQIRQEQNQAVFQARKEFNEKIKEGAVGREVLLSQLNAAITQSQLEAQRKRREAGISVVTPSPERQPGVQLIAGGREVAVRDFFEAKESQTEATEVLSEGQEEVEQGVINKLQQRLLSTRVGEEFKRFQQSKERIGLLLIPESERKRREVRKEKAVEVLEKGVDILFQPISPKLESQKTDLGTKIEDLERGFIKGAITFPVREPEKFLILGGIGQALPLVIPKITTGITTGISAVLGGGAKAGVAAKTITTLAGIGLGTKFAIDVTQQVKTAETFEEKGAILGETFVEIGLLGGARAKPAIQLKKTFPELRKELLPQKQVIRKAPTDVEVLRALRQIRKEAKFKRVPRVRRISQQRVQAQTEKLLQQERLRQITIKRIDPLQQVREAIKSELKIRKGLAEKGLLKQEFKPTEIQKISLERFKAQQRIDVAVKKRLSPITEAEKTIVNQLARDIKLSSKIKELGLEKKPKIKTRIKAPPPKKPRELTISDKIIDKISIETSKKTKDLTITEKLLKKKGDVIKTQTFEKIIEFEPTPTPEFKAIKLRELSLKRLNLIEAQKQARALKNLLPKQIKPSKIGLERLRQEQKIKGLREISKEKVLGLTTEAERTTVNKLARDIKFLQKAATPEKKFGIEITKPRAKRSVIEELFKKRGSLLKEEVKFVKPEQKGLVKFQREQRILDTRKELQFPGEGLRKLRDSLVTEIKAQPTEIRQLALERLRQQRISSAISKGRKVKVDDLNIKITRVEPKVKPIIEIFKELPVKITPVRQQLVQVLKEPEVIKIIKPIVKPPKSKVRKSIIEDFKDLEISRIKKAFPGFTEPTTKFKSPQGRIKQFEDFGKIKEIDIIQGRIPAGVLGGLGRETQIQLEKEILKRPSKIKTIQEPQLDIDEGLFIAFPPRERARTIIEEDLAFAQPQAQKQPEVLKFAQPQEIIQDLIFAQPQPQAQKQKQPEEEILEEIQEEIGKQEKFGAFLFRRKGIAGLASQDTQPFDVFAKESKTGRIKKINRVPLSKSRAEDLRNYIIDTSLSRSGEIRRTKGKIKNPTLDIPIGYADETDYKFRKFKQVKGKRKPLKEGAVIERNNFIGDTTQEIKGLNINKRLDQLNKRRIKNSLNMLS